VRRVSGCPRSVIVRAVVFIVGYLDHRVGDIFRIREVFVVLDFFVIFGDGDQIVRGDGQRFRRPLQPFQSFASVALGLLDPRYSLTLLRVSSPGCAAMATAHL
jgi:hypothetical protein